MEKKIKIALERIGGCPIIIDDKRDLVVCIKDQFTTSYKTIEDKLNNSVEFTKAEKLYLLDTIAKDNPLGLSIIDKLEKLGE